MQQKSPSDKHIPVTLWDVCVRGAREEHNEEQRWG